MKTLHPMTKSPRAVAQEALRLAQAAVPAYSSKFSRTDYTQHQLFPILVINTFLDTDYRGIVAVPKRIHRGHHPPLRIVHLRTGLVQRIVYRDHTIERIVHPCGGVPHRIRVRDDIIRRIIRSRGVISLHLSSTANSIELIGYCKFNV
jgi:hypothetical protein